MFALSLDQICSKTPNLLESGPMLKYFVWIANSNSSGIVGARMMFDYEWELLKDKFIAAKTVLSERNDAAHH